MRKARSCAHTSYGYECVCLCVCACEYAFYAHRAVNVVHSIHQTWKIDIEWEMGFCMYACTKMHNTIVHIHRMRLTHRVTLNDTKGEASKREKESERWNKINIAAVQKSGKESHWSDMRREQKGEKCVVENDRRRRKSGEKRRDEEKMCVCTLLPSENKLVNIQ